VFRFVSVLVVVLFSRALWGCSTPPSTPDAACVLGNWTRECEDLLPDGSLDADATPSADAAPVDAPPDASPPSPSRYARCSGAADCAASETCRPLIAGGASACLTRCMTNADCPRAPEGATSPPTCSQDGWCFLTCSAALACPATLRCEMLTAAVGYCR
jgi:hypothetical protein